MSEDFRAVLADLAHAATTFTHEGTDLGGIAGRLPTAAPVTGDGALDAELDTVVDTVQLLGQALAARIGDHGDKLAGAHDGFRFTDVGNKRLFDALMPDVPQGTPKGRGPS